MIRLTIKSNGNPIYIAPENITAICDNKEGGAEVYSGHDFSLVRETAAEVARKVLEWRLAMERDRAGIFAEAKETGEEAKMLAWARDVEYRIMLNLAGLEEPNHDT